MAEIRILRAADYDAVCALWQATPGMGLRSLDDSRVGIEGFLRRNPRTCFLATEGERVAGTLLCGHDGRRGTLYHVVVAAPYRRQGIGSALVTRALAALRAEGIHKVALVVFARNADGNAFWERLGFAPRTDLVYRDFSLNQDNR